MPTIELEIIPRRQFRPYLQRKQRFACLVCHRRAGKTYSCLQDILVRAMTSKRPGPPPRFGYIAPTRDQAKDISWGYLRRFVEPIPGVTVNQAELSMVLPGGAQIRLYSGDSYDRMRGLYFDGVVIDEPADIDEEAWSAVIRPCLSDYLGWASFIGTPKGKNAFYKRWVEAKSKPDEWFSLMLKASETGIIAANELASLREGTPADLYAQEYECDFTIGMPGAIYAAWIEKARASGRIAQMPIDGSSPVHTAWDLGSPLNTVVWYFQTVGRMIRVLGCDSELDETAVERVARMRGLGLNLGTHFLPHDGDQTDRTGRTMSSELRSAGLQNVVVVPRARNIWLGIDHARQMFSSLEFREPECSAGIAALEVYHTKEAKEGMLSRSDPVHDWSSHTADAFRTMAEAHLQGLFKFSHVDTPRSQQRPQAIMGSRRW
jgi:hypothetical protein